MLNRLHVRVLEGGDPMEPATGEELPLESLLTTTGPSTPRLRVKQILVRHQRQRKSQGHNTQPRQAMPGIGIHLPTREHTLEVRESLRRAKARTQKGTRRFHVKKDVGPWIGAKEGRMTLNKSPVAVPAMKKIIHGLRRHIDLAIIQGSVAALLGPFKAIR